MAPKALDGAAELELGRGLAVGREPGTSGSASRNRYSPSGVRVSIPWNVARAPSTFARVTCCVSGAAPGAAPAG